MELFCQSKLYMEAEAVVSGFPGTSVKRAVENNVATCFPIIFSTVMLL